MEKGKDLHIRTNVGIINCPAKSSKELKPIDGSNDFLNSKERYFDQKKKKEKNEKEKLRGHKLNSEIK